MSTNPSDPHSAVDDFNSLGIRTNEARPRIIRQAAARKAELLQRQRLATGNGNIDNDVTRLCLTLYKVLDPRRRMTPTERALLSQLEPIPLIESRWVHPRSRQQPKRPAGQRHGFGAVAYESLSTGQANFPDPDAPLPTQWQLFLERWVIYARQRVIWAALFLALLVGMLLARQLHVRKIASDAAQPRHIPSDSVNTSTAPDLVSPEPVSPEPVSPEPVSPAPTAPEPDPELPPLPPVPEEFSQLLADLQAYVEPFTKPLTESGSDQAMGSDPQTGSDVATGSDSAEEPAAPATDLPPPDTTVPVVAMPAEPADPDPPIELPGKPAKPADDALATARQRLLNLLADRPAAVTEAGRELAVDDILDMRLGTAQGSADYWVISEVAAERLIGLGKFQRAAGLIADLEQQYDIQPPELTQSITTRLAKSAQTLAEHRQLVRWALVCSERFLQSERFDAASEITRTVLPSLGKVNDPALRTQLSTRRDAIVIMRRMSETTQRIMQAHSLDDVSNNDATLVGRYRCLMLRDWSAGLAWLAQASDPRLAQAAASEILWLGKPDSSISEAVELANTWLETGKRLHGRMNDSARLHAYDILTAAAADLPVEQAGGLEAGELQQQIETLRKELGDLLPGDTATSPNPAAPPAVAPAAGLAPVGMGGRLLIDGQDRGAAIRYEPGTVIDQNTITKILRALGQPVAPAVLEFQGTLRLEKATTVQIVAAGPPAGNGGQLVRVNRQAQALVASVRGESVTLDLPAGLHHLFWRVDTKQLNQGFFFVVDVQTEQRLPVQMPANIKPLPADLQINLISGR
ncbi:hypothetical protein [Roseimaritima ulvae]|uniref:Uncharacterized protein n=1 Tax=Roseimaritima ulvae TaxID=980254 RepID=A0A5B9QWA3_9BACT|nr:hypothetical protein [Roseimaritima ulvae]QEG43287.1 hypothetical protein UC8_53340 [Roseimaritima ulvae]